MDRPRQRPRRLAEKLLHIRKALNLSQNEMIKRLGFDGELIQAHISAYERKRENRVPPLGVVLQYARCAGVPMEMIVDDSLDLPSELPASSQNREVQERPSGSSSRNKQGGRGGRGNRRSR
jgi:transcriptional regulator with XRE-family HTH domain